MIHTNIIARVERYSNGVADLEPLFLDDGGRPYEKIVNARVLSQRFLIPKNLIMESGSISHSPIPNNGTSHTINNGDIIIKYNENGQAQEVNLFSNYKKGDIVLACILERDFSDAIQGRKGNGGNNSIYELSSVIIVGKVM